MKLLTVLALAAATLLATNADAITHRSHKARLDFAHTHVCPSTGQYKLPCPGYVIDHVIPLCAGGPDQPSNMAYQEYRASLLKDKLERRQCGALRR